MPAFPLYRVIRRTPRAFLRYPEREDCEQFLGVFVIEQLECGHAQDIFAEVDPLIARYRRCHHCENGIAVPKKPMQSIRIDQVIKRAAGTL